MFAKLWTGLQSIIDGALALGQALRALAGTVSQADNELRERLGLPAPAPAEEIPPPQVGVVKVTSKTALPAPSKNGKKH